MEKKRKSKATKTKLQNRDNVEYIEEEMLVYVEMEPTSLTSNQIRDASSFKIVGDEKNAVIQIENKFFQGK